MQIRKKEPFGRRSHVHYLKWFVIVLICGWIHPGDGAAVMSVDLGTEWMKVGVVSPGVPMEIALNKESKRKTPAILSFRDGVRSFGEDAINVGIRDPAAAYGYLLDLLGKTIDNPIVNLYRKRFPYYKLEADEKRNSIIFRKSDNETFSVEELIAQMLVKAKEFAQESTQQTITECVLTVPGYFGQAERQALLAAAQLANLKVLQLINDYTAVALNYGVFHHAEITENAQYFVFYDMGAYKTSAAVISYQLVKEKQTKEVHPVVQVLGVGYDRTLGGLEIQLRLRDYLAAEFNAMKKTATDVTTSPRALSKLFKEAGRVKNVLSANNDHYAQIENLLEDHDFKVQVTREKLEELCADMWPRVTKPLEQAIAASGLTLDVVSQVIIIGGGTRVPKVQEILKSAIKKELGKSLNADEAATMGAVFKAADLATGFKVKKFIIKDAVVFPIHVSFERDPGDGTAIRQVKRQLFGHMNSYPQKKMITFNKYTDDFHFYVYYGDFNNLSADEISYVGGLNISLVELQKIKELLQKTQNDVVESKGIKAHFMIDDSGIFTLSSIEYVYEKQKTEEKDESTLSKLGSTISKLFSKDAGQAEEEEKAAKEDQNGEETLPESDEESKANSNNSTNSSNAQNTTDGDIEKPTNETVQLVTIKLPVENKVTIQFTNALSGEDFQKSLDKLDAINKAEFNRNRLESAFNALESHVIETQQKLEENSYASCASPEEKQKILEQCSAISEWLYEDIDNPTPEVYEKRLDDLKALTNVFMARYWEHEERPEALQALDGMIESAKKFLKTAKNMTKENNPEKDIFTEVELETLSKVIGEAAQWKSTEDAAQKKLKRYEQVRLTIEDISRKMSLIDREVKYLVNKIKIWKPKPKTSKKSKENSTEEPNEAINIEPTIVEGSSADSNNNEKSEEQEEVVDDPQNKQQEEEAKQTTPRSDL